MLELKLLQNAVDERHERIVVPAREHSDVMKTRSMSDMSASLYLHESIVTS